MIRRGILLYSGGLDSLLAGKILLKQGIELVGYHFILPFVAPDIDPETLTPSMLAKQIDLPLKHIRLGKDYMAMVQNPPHGHGRHMNPCIDCKIFFLRYAAQSMEAEDASFVATGEVIGQRPMSQMRHMMRHIEKESGLEGKLLRPLCARRLPLTDAEKAGIVDREGLLDISGRGRARQMELARQFGITEYQSPAGGCLFTDVKISQRVRDLLAHHQDYSMTDVYLLTVGRHFRLNDTTKFIIARNEKENIELLKYRGEADFFFEPQFKGPCAFVRGILNAETQEIVLCAIARYGKPGDNNDAIVQHTPEKAIMPLPEKSVADDFLHNLMI